MSKIVVLGTSVAAIKAIEDIRQNDQASEITLFAFDGFYAYDRTLFSKLIAKEIATSDCLYRQKSFYEKNRINVIFDKTITRINTKRNKIFTEEKDQFDYDLLLIADSPTHKFPDIKGTNKIGLLGLKRLKDIDQIVKSIPIFDTVIINGDSLFSLQIAYALIKRGKEVILIVSTDRLLAMILEDEPSKWLMSFLEEKGLRIIVNNSIAEVLGDSDAKAVRLKSGKVIGAQLICFENTAEDLRIFAEAGIEVKNKICVDHQFKTNVDNVFALDQVCEGADAQMTFDIGVSSSVLEEQGKVVAAKIANQELAFTSLLTINSFEAEGFSCVFIGKIEQSSTIVQHQVIDPVSKNYKKIFIDNGSIVGAILVNANKESDKFFNLIKDKVGVGGLEDFVLDAQNDYARIVDEVQKRSAPTDPAVNTV